MRQRHRLRWDLDSDADFWDYFIWKSFRKDWSREYNLDLVTTAPGVVYHVYKTNGEMVEVTNPSNLPDPSEIEHMEEPVVNAEIMVTTEFVWAQFKTLCQERRGVSPWKWNTWRRQERFSNMYCR